MKAVFLIRFEFDMKSYRIQFFDDRLITNTDMQQSEHDMTAVYGITDKRMPARSAIYL